VKPNDLEGGLFAKLTAGANPVSFIIAGTKRSRAFDTDERVSLFTELIPHLQQALITQRHTTALRERPGNFREVVDRLNHGVVIVTKNMQIVDTNAAASRIIAERDGLQVSNSELVAALPADDRALRGLIHQALVADGVRRGGVMTCQRISGKRAYVLHLLPIEPATADLNARPLAMVLIVDPTHQPPSIEQILRQLYGLTKAEASVAHLVLYGDGVQAISDRLSLSSATVRTHLRAIFAKTGTHRQAELVRLLSTIVP
jgi:DNA-binding CsgD family transcriptional regulator/PAS domain-containing protein